MYNVKLPSNINVITSNKENDMIAKGLCSCEIEKELKRSGRAYIKEHSNKNISEVFGAICDKLNELSSDGGIEFVYYSTSPEDKTMYLMIKNHVHKNSINMVIGINGKRVNCVMSFSPLS